MLKCLENIICVLIMYIEIVFAICVAEKIATTIKKKIKDRRKHIAE